MDTNDQQHNSDTPTSMLAEAAEAVRKLAAVLEEHHLAKIDVTLGALHIRLKAGKKTEVVAATSVSDVIQTALPAGSDLGHVVTAPMIGTYYSSPSPGDPPFVAVGDRIEIGQVIGIIEAMKIMNEITADRAGTVAEVFVTNAQPVEYGSPLVRLSLA